MRQLRNELLKYQQSETDPDRKRAMATSVRHPSLWWCQILMAVIPLEGKL